MGKGRSGPNLHICFYISCRRPFLGTFLFAPKSLPVTSWGRHNYQLLAVCVEQWGGLLPIQEPQASILHLLSTCYVPGTVPRASNILWGEFLMPVF